MFILHNNFLLCISTHFSPLQFLYVLCINLGIRIYKIFRMINFMDLIFLFEIFLRVYAHQQSLQIIDLAAIYLRINNNKVSERLFSTGTIKFFFVLYCQIHCPFKIWTLLNFLLTIFDFPREARSIPHHPLPTERNEVYNCIPHSKFDLENFIAWKIENLHGTIGKSCRYVFNFLR